MAKDDLIGGIGRGPMVDPTRYPKLKCDKCGYDIFRSATIIYNVPGVVLGNGTEDIPYPIPVYVCDKCGTVIKSVRDELEKIEKEKEQKSESIKSTSLIL